MPAETKTILIVDDSSFMRTVLRVAMQSQGYAVREASQGDEALQLLQETVPDLLISDYDMPGLDGLQLLAHVRCDERTRDIPVMILSSRSDPHLQTVARRNGAGWVQKPFQTADFLELVAGTMGSDLIPAQ